VDFLETSVKYKDGSVENSSRTGSGGGSGGAGAAGAFFVYFHQTEK
jgi:hypothetical protein